MEWFLHVNQEFIFARESLGVRIENDILVSDSEPIDLMEGIPVEANHIEEIMNS